MLVSPITSRKPRSSNLIDASDTSVASQLRTATPILSRLLSAIFLAFALFCLVFPLIQTVYPVVDWVRPLEERRSPTSFPAIALLRGANGNFARQLNAWFDDRVGFRDLFIRTKNQIDYSLFRSSRKEFIGKDGWLFDRVGYQEFEKISPEALAATENRFTLLAERLKQRGIRLIVVGYPDKAVIYPELTTGQMPAVAVGGNFDKLRHFLATQPSFSFIDATALLHQQRQLTSDHLFAKTDMHPTVIGQVPVVRAIVEEVGRLEGRTEMPLREYEFTHVTIPNDWGGEARFLSLLEPMTEPDLPNVIPTDQIGADEPDGKWTIVDHIGGADEGIGRPFDFEFRSAPELCETRLPTTVLFGNSFSDLYWMLGMHHYFCSIRRARDPMSRFKLFYQTMPADTKYMIYEFVEFGLPASAPPDNYVE